MARKKTHVRSYTRRRHGKSSTGGRVRDHDRGYEAASGLKRAIKKVEDTKYEVVWESPAGVEIGVVLSADEHDRDVWNVEAGSFPEDVTVLSSHKTRQQAISFTKQRLKASQDKIDEYYREYGEFEAYNMFGQEGDSVEEGMRRMELFYILNPEAPL
jgi:hypothetical protein